MSRLGLERQQRLKSFVNGLRLPSGGNDEAPAGAFPQDSVERLLEKSPFAKSNSERERVADIHRKLQTDQPLAPGERKLYEAIILPTGRPPLLIQNGTFAPPPEPWVELNGEPFRSKLEAAIPAVGRIELTGQSSLPFAGTGFVVGPGLIMTNRHVARIFGSGSGLSARFIDGLGSAVDFLKEDGNTRRDLHTVARILMIHPYWDMALLKVENLTTKPLSLAPIAPDDHKGRRVAVIGYPFEDSRNPLDLQYRVFDGKFGVKRLQPGFGLGSLQHTNDEGTFQVFGHDASTLGGNSGSAVLDPATGRVLGLHFAGEYTVSNFAVPAYELSRDARVRDAGVTFDSGNADTPNPWQSEWSDTEAVGGGDTDVTEKRTSLGNGNGASATSGSVIRIPIDIQIRIGTPH